MADKIVMSKDPRFKNLTGMKFGRLTVIEYAGRLRSYQHHYWKCVCECGNVTQVCTGQLRNGRTQSCGCLMRDLASAKSKTHGATVGIKSGERSAPDGEYVTWGMMKTRCTNQKVPNYPKYGGRGISVCERWMNSFAAFLEDMGRKPSPKHSIERIDVNGNYEPANCRWASQKEQTRNTRRNHFVTAFGETKCVSEWSEVTGIKIRTILSRIRRGKSPEEALKTSVQILPTSPNTEIKL